MAKHAHKLILQKKKTWRCTLEDCSFFVHKGLEHILVGKTCTCWECNEMFVMDEYALQEEMPRCTECRLIKPVEQVVQVEEPEMTTESEKARLKLYRELGYIK